MDAPGIELESLLGEHTLDAVDTFVEKVNTYGSYFEDAEVIRFRLDGIVYTAIENPDDDYRSSMDKLFVSSDEMKNVFPPIRVVVRKKENEPYQVNESLEFIDAVTGLIVLAVGTNNTDDYYPYFVSEFNPQNMATNAAGLTPDRTDGKLNGDPS